MSALSLEAYRALSDAEKKAAVARALRWETYYEHADGAAGGHSPSWKRGGAGAAALPFECRFDPPPYVAAGDSDPFAGWQWLAEMVEALCGAKAATEAIVSPSHEMAIVRVVDDVGETIAEAGSQSPHRAAAEAMAAAGLLEENPDEG